jgi:hypothetical protein
MLVVGNENLEIGVTILTYFSLLGERERERERQN